MITQSNGVELTHIGTAVVWIGFAAVGAVGILIPSNSGVVSAKPQAAVEATLIHVQLSSDALPTPNALSPPAMANDAPQPEPVQSPSPAVAFAVPSSQPAVVASPAVVNLPARHDAVSQQQLSVHRITFGEGEGRQPRPEYPPEAVLAGQEGSVFVRFTIDANGRVASAEAIQPSPYALLNQSAVRTIREDWRFAPGPVRVREIAIEFDLKRK